MRSEAVPSSLLCSTGSHQLSCRLVSGNVLTFQLTGWANKWLNPYSDLQYRFTPLHTLDRVCVSTGLALFLLCFCTNAHVASPAPDLCSFGPQHPPPFNPRVRLARRAKVLPVLQQGERQGAPYQQHGLKWHPWRAWWRSPAQSCHRQKRCSCPETGEEALGTKITFSRVRDSSQNGCFRNRNVIEVRRDQFVVIGIHPVPKLKKPFEHHNIITAKVPSKTFWAPQCKYCKSTIQNLLGPTI